MKIAILTQSTYPFEVGGAQLHTYYLAKALKKDQHEVTVITTGNRKSHQVIENIDFRRVKIPRRFLCSIFAFFKFYPELLRCSPAFVIIDLVTTGITELPVFFVNLLQKTPYLVTVHGIEVKNQNFLVRFFQALLLSHAKYIVTVSNEIAKVMPTEYSIDPRKIRIIPTGYCSSDIEHVKNKIRRLNKRTMEVVFVGRLAPEKDPLTLIKAIRILVDEGNDVRLNVIGNGPLLGDLKSFCVNNELASSVCFFGQTDHNTALEYICRSDMLVLSSVGEGLPTVIIEAMALGTPVIATNVGAVPELIKNGDNGLIVPPRSPGKLASAMIQVKKDMTLGKSLSKNANRSVKSLTWERISKKYVELLDTNR